MVMYTPGALPQGSDVSALRLAVERELRTIAATFGQSVDSATFNTLYAPPKKLAEGLVANADGTLWAPGAAAGLYQYRGGSWHYLG